MAIRALVTINEIAPIYANVYLTEVQAQNAALLSAISPTAASSTAEGAFQYVIPAFQSDAFQLFSFTDPAMASVSVSEM